MEVHVCLCSLSCTHTAQEDIVWRFGAPPDYTVANYAFATGKTKAHAPGSLEMIVENLVKTWEMERSHKSEEGRGTCNIRRGRYSVHIPRYSHLSGLTT